MFLKVTRPVHTSDGQGLSPGLVGWLDWCLPCVPDCSLHSPLTPSLLGSLIWGLFLWLLLFNQTFPEK